jgi:hypothetical protein
VVDDSRSGKEDACESRRSVEINPPVVGCLAEVRAAIVVKKRGNARGAKGGRKVKHDDVESIQNSDKRLSAKTRSVAVKDLIEKQKRVMVPVRAIEAREVGGKIVLAYIEAGTLRREVKRQPESRVREIRTHGSEGGAAQTNVSSLPLSLL